MPLRQRYTDKTLLSVTRDQFRMAQWLMFAVTCLIVADGLAYHDMLPQWQIVFRKSGLFTLGAWLGARVDMSRFQYHRISKQNGEGSDDPIDRIRVAIIIAAGGICLAIGL